MWHCWKLLNIHKLPPMYVTCYFRRVVIGMEYNLVMVNIVMILMFFLFFLYLVIRLICDPSLPHILCFNSSKEQMTLELVSSVQFHESVQSLFSWINWIKFILQIATYHWNELRWLKYLVIKLCGIYALIILTRFFFFFLIV